MREKSDGALYSIGIYTTIVVILILKHGTNIRSHKSGISNGDGMHLSSTPRSRLSMHCNQFISFLYTEDYITNFASSFSPFFLPSLFPVPTGGWRRPSFT